MRGRRVVVALLGALVVVLAAIGASEQSALAATVPAGYERVDVKSAGISVLVPEGMRRKKRVATSRSRRSTAASTSTTR